MQTIIRIFCRLALCLIPLLSIADEFSVPAELTLEHIKQQSSQIKQSSGVQQNFQFLKGLSDQFIDDPEYHYMVGLAALEAGLYHEAVLSFERAVLMQPNFAGAWLDLSIAYFRLGQLDTAQQIINHIEENFAPPPKLALELSNAKKMMKENTLANHWKTEVSVLAGHIKNANYGINTSTLQLTLIDGDLITARLSPEFKPRSDNAYETRFATSRRFQHENGAFSDVQIAARVREYANVDTQSFIDLAGSWSHLRPMANVPGVYGLLATSYRHFMLDGENLVGFSTISAGVKKYMANCGASLRHEHEMRNFYSAGLYDATVPWIAVGGECYWNKWSAQVDYRLGWDKPDGPRVGGTTKREELSAILRWDVSADFYARGILYFADYQDQQGYSPLIKSGVERYIHRIGQRLELSWRLPESLASRWYGLLELDNVNTTSNIPLSRYDDTQVFMGFRYQFY